jgi:hypothetical protein
LRTVCRIVSGERFIVRAMRTGDLVHAAVATPRQPTRAAQDLRALLHHHLREVRATLDLIAMRAEEPVDAREQETPRAACRRGRGTAARAILCDASAARSCS